jgi:hypothetical protein
VFGVDEDFARPQTLGDFGARDKPALAARKQDEQFHGLAFETKGAAMAEEFETAAIEPKAAEFEDGRGHTSGLAAEV